MPWFELAILIVAFVFCINNASGSPVTWRQISWGVAAVCVLIVFIILVVQGVTHQAVALREVYHVFVVRALLFHGV